MWKSLTGPALLVLVLASCTAPDATDRAQTPEIRTHVGGCWARGVSTGRADGAKGEVRFETPCPPAFDAEFVTSLQRALRARDYFRWQDTGVMDGPTRTAIRRYQADHGLDSEALSLETARGFGLLRHSDYAPGRLADDGLFP